MAFSSALACGTTCPRTVLGMALAFCTCTVTPATAAECVFPDNVNWLVNASCEISVIRIAPRNLSVINGATLTIESTGELILDMRAFQINIDPQSRIVVEDGGRIRSNQIGPLLVRRVDGGTFGYYLRRVGGGFFDSINPDLSFHPSSTIKVLYMIEALRQVDAGTLNLGTTQLNSCPGADTDGDNLPDDFTLIAGPGQTCPNSFSQASAGGGGGNCAVTTNTANNCGFPTINYGLGLGMCAMMKVSNNPAANAIQEAVGAGNPQTGWNNMLNNAGATIGLSATSLANRMGCNGPNNAMNNQTTLRDLGLMFEQMATNPAVLFPANPPGAFNFVNTNAYNFMDNHVNELNVTNIPNIVNEQAGEMGLDITTINNFLAAVRLVHKRGSNNTSNSNPVFRTIAGWVSFPIDGGADTRDYVYGVFVNNATPDVDNDGDGVNDDISLGALNNEATEMLRPVIRDALEAF